MAYVMVPFINGKGGVGKTAIACSYAVAQALKGVDVLLADTNEEQRTALAWTQVRDHNSLLPKIKVEAINARQALELVGRHDAIIVDTPGFTDRSTLALARKATFTVIPTGPNPTYELAPTVRLLHGLRAEGIEAWRLGVVFSRFSPDEATRAAEEQVARAYLKEAGYSALEGCIQNASAFGAALGEGYGLTEVPDGGALVAEASHVMQVIEKGVASAERRLQRSAHQHGGTERKRGGREE